MPFAYKRTGVLTANLKARGLVNAGRTYPVTTGARGFYVGLYGTRSQFGGMNFELWCFLPAASDDAPTSLCLDMFPSHVDVGVVGNANPYWVDKSVAKWPAATQGVSDYAAIDERPVAISKAQVLEYRFLGWTRAGAEVAFLVGHVASGEYNVSLEADGSVHLGLLGGSYLRLVRDPENPARARATFVPTGARMTPG